MVQIRKLGNIKIKAVESKNGCSGCWCVNHLEYCAYNGNPATGYCVRQDRDDRTDIMFVEVK
jgi:hypothetical protein